MFPRAERVHVSGNQEEKRNGHATTNDESNEWILEERDRAIFLDSG
jgi:hypothetical protein